MIPAVPEMSCPNPITVRELADELGVRPVVLIKRLMSMGILATVGQPLPAEIVAALRAWFDADSGDD